METKTCRIRRILAFVIDWNLSGLPAFLSCLLLLPLVAAEKLPIPVMILFMISFPVLFLFRERLFRGRSPGKRLMKLVILDRRTLQPLNPGSLTTRNMMLLFLSGLEALMLITTGSTLGDRAVGALVVREHEIPAEPPRRTPSSGKSALKIVIAVLLVIALFVGIVLAALESVKDEPHYALAHSYLLKSESFGLLDAQPGNIRFTGYEKNSSLVDGEREVTATFTFQVKGRIFEVICHGDESGWYVCEDCTRFQ